MGQGFRLGEFLGLEIRIHASLTIIFALILFSLGLGVFPQWHPEWSSATVWTTALVAALLFFVSVLIHEMSHALVGRSYGIPVRRITLFVFGGMAHMEGEPGHWRGEFWMAIVGPIASLVLGLLFAWLASLSIAPGIVDLQNPQKTLAAAGPLTTVFLWLAPINIILALFNLVPGFPLDGGRVLRALLWGATGRIDVATRWAAALGQGFAWLLIGCGFAMMLGARVPVFGTGMISGLWLALIGWFLNTAAASSHRQLLVRMRLQSVPVSRLMTAELRSVSPDLPVTELVESYILRSDQRSFPVEDEDGMLGFVTLSDVRKLPREQWGDQTVAQIMVPREKVITVAPEDQASDAAMKIAQHGYNQLPVVEAGRVRGLLRREDILKWLSLYGDEPASLG